MLHLILEAHIHLHARDETVQLPPGTEKRKEVRKERRIQSLGLILGKVTWSGKKSREKKDVQELQKDAQANQASHNHGFGPFHYLTPTSFSVSFVGWR